MPGTLKADVMGSEVAGRSFQRDYGATFTDVFDKMQAGRRRRAQRDNARADEAHE